MENFKQCPINLWPPSQDTRGVLVEEMIKRLFSPSLLSERYGFFPTEVAKEKAIEIEEKAFSAVNEQYNSGIGISAVRAVKVYNKESTKLLEELIKKGAPTVFYLSGGGLMEAEEAKVMLKPLTERNSYTKICFNTRSFGLGAAQVAGPILASLKDQLREVDLSDFMAETPKDEAIQVMSIFSAALEGCALKYLDLSNNFLGEKGVLAFLRNQHRLEKLYLMNVGICKSVLEKLYLCMGCTQRLKVLHFDKDMVGDLGSRAIGILVMCSPALEDFRCSSTYLGAIEGSSIIIALKDRTNIEKLNLSGNRFDDLFGTGLSKALALQRRLTEINLSDMDLKDRVVIALANALKENAPFLEVLSMAENNITTDAILVLAECIASKRFLTKLNLSKNKLKNQGAFQISKALEGHHRLKEVDLSTNSITMDGARYLAQVVVHMPKFQFLNINGNYLSVEGIDELREILKNTPHVLGPLDKNDPAGDDELD